MTQIAQDDTSPQESSRGSILVVDDVPDNLRLLSAMLTNEGYEVRCVISGTAALMGIQAEPPDLILLDIMLPEIDGYQICQQLKMHERTRDIPVIFISALDDAWDKVRAFTVGGVDYITKPFQVVEVLARINTHLTLDRQRKELVAMSIRQRELEKFNELRDDFISRISHELRTPLSNMRMALRMSRQMPTLEKTQDYLAIIAEECEREIQLVDDLLNLRSFESATHTLSLESVDLRQWLPRIIQNIQPPDACEPKLQIEGEEALCVETDTFYLGRIITELLTNAYKHTSNPQTVLVQVGQLLLLGSGNGTPHTRVGICITITNQSQIPATELPHVFETFRQVTTSDRWRTSGTGLGLGLVKRMIEALDGVISVNSQGGLTQFSLWIPA